MIVGVVTAQREAVLQVTLHDANSHAHSLNATVDTGFDDWITLPLTMIVALGLPLLRSGNGILANGSAAVFNIYEATVVWDGNPQAVSVYEIDSDPTVGMALMYGYELVLPILDGATFTLRSITNA